jgi:SAM-dependent methyltransferase
VRPWRDGRRRLTDALARRRQSDNEGRYLLADAAALPFADASFELAVAYNSRMDVQDMPAALREAARVLTPRGRMAACVTHPLANAGAFAADDPGAPFVIAETYFGRRCFEGTDERSGLRMTFHGWSYSLEDYSRALEAAELVIEALREPPFPGCDPVEQRWRRVPLFLMFRARKSCAADPAPPA